jgi:hypothetical protein
MATLTLSSELTADKSSVQEPSETFASLSATADAGGELSPSQIAYIRREWQHCNYEFVFAPHRFLQAMSNVADDIKIATFYAPYSDDDEDLAMKQSARSRFGEDSTLKQKLDMALTNAQQTAYYHKSAISAVLSFGISLEREKRLCERYVNSRMVARKRSDLFHHFISYSEDLFSTAQGKKPFILPTLLIQPWYSFLLRGAISSDEMVVEQFIEAHPSIPHALQCTIRAENIPFIFLAANTDPKQRESWQILQDRVKHCSLLNLPYDAVVEGDIVQNSGELSTLQERSPSSSAQVCITLTLPLLTPSHVHLLNLSIEDLDVEFDEAVEVIQYLGMTI